MPDTLLKITVDGDTAVVSGELDASTVPRLRIVLDNSPRIRRLDMADVTFLDSSALHLIIHARNATPDFRITAASRTVRRLLQLTALTEFLQEQSITEDCRTT